jgi:hypothetical protein
MSIVITVVTPNVVVQVSDIRLTYFNGKPHEKKQRKSALVVGTDAAFVIGWTGFAESTDKEFNTGDWLFRTLNHIKAYEKPLVDILGDLTTAGWRARLVAKQPSFSRTLGSAGGFSRMLRSLRCDIDSRDHACCAASSL